MSVQNMIGSLIASGYELGVNHYTHVGSDAPLTPTGKRHQVREAGDRLLSVLKLHLPTEDDESTPLRVDMERLLDRAERIMKRAE